MPMNADDVRRLFAYNKWANDRTLESLDALSDEQFTRNLGSSFSSIQTTAAHIAGAEWIWLSRWKGTSPAAMPEWVKSPSLIELKSKFAELEAERAAWMSSLTDGDITRPISFRLLNGTETSAPLEPQFQHLVNHGTYHRGQVAAMLRQVGATPAGTDLIRWIRET